MIGSRRPKEFEIGRTGPRRENVRRTAACPALAQQHASRAQLGLRATRYRLVRVPPCRSKTRVLVPACQSLSPPAVFDPPSRRRREESSVTGQTGRKIWPRARARECLPFTDLSGRCAKVSSLFFLPFADLSAFVCAVVAENRTEPLP